MHFRSIHVTAPRISALGTGNLGFKQGTQGPARHQEQEGEWATEDRADLSVVYTRHRELHPLSGPKHRKECLASAGLTPALCREKPTHKLVGLTDQPCPAQGLWFQPGERICF